jgi:hypothetical protein
MIGRNLLVLTLAITIRALRRESERASSGESTQRNAVKAFCQRKRNAVKAFCQIGSSAA